MRHRKKRIGLCLLLVLTLLFCGCQTSAVKEEQALASSSGTGQTETTSDPDSKEKPEKEDSENAEDSRKETEKTDDPEYIDEQYVDQHYGAEDESEDLSKYKKSNSSSPTAEAESSSADAEDKIPGNGTGSGSNGTESASSGEEASADNYYTDPIPEGRPDPVEPQDQTVDNSNQLTCTLYVECSTILNNMGDLTEGKEDWVPADGVIYGPKTVTFSEGESVYDILQREMQNNRIHMESQFTAMYNSAYVQGIHNLYEKDCGQWSGWMYEVNGWYPNYGCSRYQVQPGDVIEWHYTCDLGRDLGADMS